ncbi:MAG: response regulator [archaeon]|nr:response regulator [archaeon]
MNESKTKGKVLCVDDEAEVLNAVKNVLESDNYEVITARDGLEAVRLFKQNESKLCGIVLDLNMPGISGRDVLTEIRKTYKSQIPIVILTAWKTLLPKENTEDSKTKLIEKPFCYEPFLKYVNTVFPKYAQRKY